MYGCDPDDKTYSDRNQQESSEMASKSTDWNVYAVTQANRAAKLCRHVERSVALGEVPGPLVLRKNDEGQLVMARSFAGLGIGVFFGNDGFLQSAKVRVEVNVLRRLLTLKGIQVLGFGVSDTAHPQGKSWALVVRNDDLRLLSTILNAAHGVVFYRGVPPLEAVVRNWLHELAVDPEQLSVGD